MGVAHALMLYMTRFLTRVKDAHNVSFNRHECTHVSIVSKQYSDLEGMPRSSIVLRGPLSKSASCNRVEHFLTSQNECVCTGFRVMVIPRP